ncbi:hypothetical protein AAFF_G00117660 [Aldrovandia affinis]|uniref:Uncharacterized protein n=1 Tax=Aldrovandia affinis TaxID=143900 RepID=A0AAD7WXM6_9TELE|nr:hypothetical protein AAFF_G00117660 [Aldrovandia affinis]
MPGPAVRVVGAADVQAIREDVIAATQRQRPTAGLCYYHASLLVDVRNRRLVNAETFATLPGSPSSTGTSKLSSALSSADMFQRLLMDFPDLTTPTFSSAAVKHGVDHFIATTGPPVHARARRLDPQKLAVAKAEFDSMERLGIVLDAVNLGVDYGQMAADQASDPEVQALRAATTGLQLQEGHQAVELGWEPLKLVGWGTP